MEQKKNVRILVADNHEDGMYKCRGELLARLAMEYDVYVSVPKGKYTKALQDLGCHFENLTIDRRGVNAFSEFGLLRRYHKLLDRVNPDIVLTYSIKPNVYLGILCGRHKIPYIANVTGLGSSMQAGTGQKLMMALYRMGLKNADTVFFQNETNRDIMLQHHLVHGDYALIPGSGVNLITHCYEPYPERDVPIHFLTIGRIMKEKGTDELIDAARIVKKKYPYVLFRMIGFYDGDYQGKIQRAQEEGLIEFCGHQDDVHAYIRQCHAVIHPSYHEGMANALLEAAATGRPVIASDIPGCREAFDAGVSGLACKAQDAESLADAILRFIDLPYEKKVSMGKAGREKMEREFDRNIVIEKYLQKIKELTAS